MSYTDPEYNDTRDKDVIGSRTPSHAIHANPARYGRDCNEQKAWARCKLAQAAHGPAGPTRRKVSLLPETLRRLLAVQPLNPRLRLGNGRCLVLPFLGVLCRAVQTSVYASIGLLCDRIELLRLPCDCRRRCCRTKYPVLNTFRTYPFLNTFRTYTAFPPHFVYEGLVQHEHDE